MRGGVLQLHRWGVLPRIVAAGTPAVRGTAFQYGDDVLEVAVKPSHGVDALYAPRRTVLTAPSSTPRGKPARRSATATRWWSWSAGRAAASAAPSSSTRRAGAARSRRTSSSAPTASARPSPSWSGPRSPPGSPAHQRDHLRPLVRPPRRGVPLVLPAGPERRGDPHERRAPLRLRRGAPGTVPRRRPARPRRGLPPRAGGDLAGVGGVGRGVPAGKPLLGLRGPEGFHAPGLRTRLGARRRRRLLQGPADRARHHGRAARRGAPGRGGRAGLGRRLRRIRGGARRTVPAVVRGDRRHRVLRLGSGHPPGTPSGAERGDEARGRAPGGAGQRQRRVPVRPWRHRRSKRRWRHDTRGIERRGRRRDGLGPHAQRPARRGRGRRAHAADGHARRGDVLRDDGRQEPAPLRRGARRRARLSAA